MAVWIRKLVFGVTLINAAVLLFVFHVVRIPLDLHLPYESEPSYKTSELSPSPRGYFVVLHYTDQITGAVTNLKSLMCLAKKIGGVEVVEPFVRGSRLGLNVSANWTQEMKMMDIFNYEVWNKAVSFSKFGRLVPFKTFLRNAPRKVVLVQYCFKSCYPCGHGHVISQGKMFCEMNNFELIGHECLTYRKRDIHDLASIKAFLYSKYKKSEVVIVFDTFGGINTARNRGGKDFRFEANIWQCSRWWVSGYSCLSSSQSVVSDANSYIEKYMNHSSYISVMIRLERVLRASGSSYDPSLVVSKCYTNVLFKVAYIRKKTRLEHVYLTLDIGQYGSDTFRNSTDQAVVKRIEDLTEEFISRLYRRDMTVSEWDGRYTNITTIKKSGYISVVQKEIAARGELLVLVSGETSSFQTSARLLHQKYHKKPQVYSLSGV